MPGTEEIPLWEHMQYFRSALGDAMQNPKNALFNLGKQQKSALYGSVTEDMKDVARTAELADEFTQANTTSKALRDHAEQFISPLVKDNQTPEKIIDWALGEARKGGTRLAALRDVMPTEMDNVAAVLLRKEPRAWGKMASSAQEALIPDPVLRAQVSESVARMFPTKGQGEIKSLGDKIVGSEIGAAIGLGMHSLVPGLSELQAGALGQVGGLLAPSLRKIGAATINGTGNALLPGFIGAEVGGRGRGDNAE
jgi:hypothetical protein